MDFGEYIMAKMLSCTCLRLQGEALSITGINKEQEDSDNIDTLLAVTFRP